MPSKHDSKSGDRRTGTELVRRYLAGETQLASDIFAYVTALASGYLKGRVRQSRQTASGVPADRDEGDILSQLQRDVFKALDCGKYKDDGRFDRFVMKLAHNAFIDALAWKKKRKKTADGESASLKNEGVPEVAEENGRASCGEAKNPHFSLPEWAEPAIDADEVAFLLEKEILNIILDGLNAVENQEAKEVWTARALLGKNEAEIGQLYGLKPDTCTSHYRRASEAILEQVHQNPAYEEVPLEGLREVVRQRLHLAESDLALIEGESRREALRLAASGELSLNELGEQLSMSPMEALKILQEAIAALARAKMRRLKPSEAAKDGQGDAWLWNQVGLAIDSFPKPPAQARGYGEPAAYAELAALGEIAVLLGFSREGAQPAKTLTDLIGPRIIKEGVNASAKVLETSRERLMTLLSGNAGAAPLEPELLTRLSSHFGLDREDILSAQRASSQAAPGLRTRAMSDDERKRYMESLRRRILGRKGNS